MKLKHPADLLVFLSFIYARQCIKYKNYLTHPMVRFHIHSFFTTFMLMRQTQETLRHGVRRLIAANPEPTRSSRDALRRCPFLRTQTYLRGEAESPAPSWRATRKEWFTISETIGGVWICPTRTENKWPAGERAKNLREYSCSTAKINAQLVRAVVY